jgi:ADP-ribose pyrophosphatase YjhB (NUDIX family)
MTGSSGAQSRLYPTRPFLAVSLAVFRDCEVLLASRAAPPFDKMYTLPGGVVEAGETLAEAACRELLEETGIVAEVIGFTGYTEFVDREEDGRVRRHFVICSFAGRWISGEGTPGEELPAMRWTRLENAKDLPLTPGLMPILEKGLALVSGAA